MRIAASFFLFLIMATPTFAMQVGIYAVVNEDVITDADIQDRMNLIFLSSGLPRDPESVRRVKERVVDNLIDEKLQMQEAKRYDILVEPSEIAQGLEKVAQQNNMEPDKLDAYFSTHGINRTTLENQIRASLSWAKVVQRVLRTQVEVGDDEVNAALERIKANEGKPEYLLAKIFLPVENPADEAKTTELAESLIARMKEGTPFAALAQQFSKSSSAINGGDLGWVQSGQLQGELDRVARDLDVSQVSLPIRTADGVVLLAKRKQQLVTASNPADIQYKLKQASFKLGNTSFAAAAADITKFSQTIPNCTTLATRGDQFPAWKVQDLGTKTLAELPEWLGKKVINQTVDKPSEAFEVSNHAILLYLCERNDSGADRDSIRNRIGLEKLELQARRLQRDLKRAASIEIKDNS